MPFKSDKQRRYMNWAAAHGKIKKSVVDEFNDASKGKKLPEKAKHKKTHSKKLTWF
jgi:hypothetical protein